MKLATYRPRSPQTPDASVAAVVGDHLVDLNYAYARYLGDVEHEDRPYEVATARLPRDMIGLLQGGDRALDAVTRTLDFVRSGSVDVGLSGERVRYGLDEVRLLAPILRPGKILAVGKNYPAHVAEAESRVGAGGSAPEVPASVPRGFVKVSSVVVGPEDGVELSHVTTQLDYEVELAVVIGRRGRYIPRDRVYDYVAGYTILNDVSPRDIQFFEITEPGSSGDLVMGKNLDTLSPMGPWIVLKDEIPDPMELQLSLKVNGETRQNERAAAMINDIPAIIERWSWMTLEPGDVITTGTPSGVALSGKYPYLKVGDVMECSIDRIGMLRNRIVAPSAAARAG